MSNANKVKSNIVNKVADTLFIPLFMKQKETVKANGFFKDETACSILEKVDYDFSKYENSRRSCVGCAIRANYFDKVTADFIKNKDNPIIVTVGCGLDARFQRLGKKITEKAIFYEVDLPEVIEFREKLIPASSNDIYIKGSMFEETWMNLLTKKHQDKSFLFIVEGVFMYFEKGMVKSVFEQLAKRFTNSQILFDVTSSWMCRNSNKHDAVKHSNAVFKLECDDDYEMESWAQNLRFISSKGYQDFKEWRQTGFFNWVMMNTVPVFKKSTRLLRYEIN